MPDIDYKERDRILHHMQRAVELAPLETVPFFHFCAEGIVPDDVYRKMLGLLPSNDFYEPFGYGDRANKQPGRRKRLRLSNESIDRLPPPARRFWYTIRSVFGSAELKAAVFSKLAPALSERFRCASEQARGIPGFPLPELFREIPGYYIKPHPDTSKKIVTMQMALARDDSQANLGTEFYRLDLRPGALIRRPRLFRLVKRIPFLPNTVYAFAVKTSLRGGSYHGRSLLPEGSGVRDTLLNLWYETPHRANEDLLAEADPAVVREGAC